MSAPIENLSEIELAWAAGFFDGEGSTSFVKNGRGGRWRTPTLSISQKHPEVLVRFQAAVGSRGAVYTRGTRDEMFQYFASGPVVFEILDLLEPYLSTEKWAQGEAVRAKYVEYQARKTKGDPRE